MRRSELKIGRTEMSRVSATNHTYPELVKIIAVDLSKPCEMRWWLIEKKKAYQHAD